MYEQQKYVEILEQLLTDKKKINIQYLPLFFLGPPNVGKTTTRDRLLKVIENIDKAGPERRTQSTPLANCNQVLAFANGDEWLSAKNPKEETQLLFGFLKEFAPGEENSTHTTSGSHSGPVVPKYVIDTKPIPACDKPHPKINDVIKRLKHSSKMW